MNGGWRFGWERGSVRRCRRRILPLLIMLQAALRSASVRPASWRICVDVLVPSLSLLKRGIFGTWHKISPKHLAAYLDEMTFRFNRRKRSDLFMDTLRHMVTAPVLTFERLTA